MKAGPAAVTAEQLTKVQGIYIEDGDPVSEKLEILRGAVLLLLTIEEGRALAAY